MTLSAPFRKILLATDFSEHARAALAQAVSIAKLYGASLTLLHVARDVCSAIEAMSFGSGGGPVTGNLDTVEDDVRRDSDARLQTLVAQCRVAGVRAGCQTGAQVSLGGLDYPAARSNGDQRRFGTM